MPGLLRGIARTAVVAGTATAVSGRVQRRQHGRWAAQEQAAAAAQPMYAPSPAEVTQAPPSYAPPPPAGSGADAMDNRLAQLKELGTLRDAGVLNEAEFEAQKRRILYE